MTSLPENDRERERYPMAAGLLYYFPNALAAVSEVSRLGNDQHNPGEAMFHARWKSTNHADKILRHLVDAGHKDSMGVRHSARMAWRALALLQEEIELDEGVPMARNARPQPRLRDLLAVSLHPAHAEGLRIREQEEEESFRHDRDGTGV